MVSTLRSRWTVVGSTFAVWALVAASAVFWALKLGGSADNAAPPPVVRSPAPVNPVALARLLGASPATAAAPQVASLASRFALLGVVAGRGRDGAALIAVDGKPAKPFRLGATVDEGLLLQSVQKRAAVLAPTMDGPPAVTLELPRTRG
jgi:general secretion pathway protein C